MAADVSTPSSAHTALMEAVDLPRALMGGTRAMRKAGKKYLPQEPREEDVAYTARLNKSTLYNAFRKTVNSYVGKPFGVPVTLGEDIPHDILPWLEDIDQQGRDLDTFARDHFRQDLIDGIGFILVDYPVVPEKLDLGTERERGLRPYWVHINADQVLGWRAVDINGKMTLTMIRLKECVDVADGEFGTTKKEQIRVLDLVDTQLGRRERIRVFVQNEKKEWVEDIEKTGVASIDFIPIVPCYTGRTGFMTAEPPLEDLAWLCCDHWQSKSDQKHILHVARVPLLFGKGLKDSTGKVVVVGANSLVHSDKDSADLKYVEHSGKAIEAGAKDLETTEEQMRRSSGEMLSSQVQKSATEAGLETREGESSLKAMVRTFEDALEQALKFTAAWVNLPRGGGLKVNREWKEDVVDPQELNVMLTAVQDGKITLKAWVLYLVEKELLPPDTDVDAEVAALEEAAAMPVPYAPVIQGPGAGTLPGQVPGGGPGGADPNADPAVQG